MDGHVSVEEHHQGNRGLMLLFAILFLATALTAAAPTLDVGFDSHIFQGLIPAVIVLVGGLFWHEKQSVLTLWAMFAFAFVIRMPLELLLDGNTIATLALLAGMGIVVEFCDYLGLFRAINAFLIRLAQGHAEVMVLFLIFLAAGLTMTADEASAGYIIAKLVFKLVQSMYPEDTQEHKDKRRALIVPLLFTVLLFGNLVSAGSVVANPVTIYFALVKGLNINDFIDSITLILFLAAIPGYLIVTRLTFTRMLPQMAEGMEKLKFKGDFVAWKVALGAVFFISLLFMLVNAHAWEHAYHLPNGLLFGGLPLSLAAIAILVFGYLEHREFSDIFVPIHEHDIRIPENVTDEEFDDYDSEEIAPYTSVPHPHQATLKKVRELVVKGSHWSMLLLIFALATAAHHLEHLGLMEQIGTAFVDLGAGVPTTISAIIHVFVGLTTMFLENFAAVVATIPILETLLRVPGFDGVYVQKMEWQMISAATNWSSLTPIAGVLAMIVNHELRHMGIKISPINWFLKTVPFVFVTGLISYFVLEWTHGEGLPIEIKIATLVIILGYLAYHMQKANLFTRLVRRLFFGVKFVAEMMIRIVT